MKTILFFKSSELQSCRKKLAGVSAVARKLGWNVQAVEPVRTEETAQQLIDLWKPGGCIVSCGAKTNAFPSAVLGRIPHIFIDRPHTALARGDSCVYHDSKATANAAARELLSLGLRHYAYANWPVPQVWNAERRDAFSAVMNRHGQPVSYFESKSPISSTKGLPRALAEWLAALPKPVGILAAADLLSAKIITAARIAKLSVPDEVAVIGIDNDEELCESSVPTLSSVEPDFFRAGVLAAESLAELMKHKGRKPIRATYPPLRLVRRESTRRLPKCDKSVSDAMELIRREACNGLAARDVFRLFPCSRRMAELRFRTATGRSILEEIRAVRLAKAKMLLAGPPMKLEALANFCGYKSAVAFSIFFKAETGLSPCAYRLSTATRTSPYGTGFRQTARARTSSLAISW